MRIGLITPEPGHPLLADTTALLTPEHEVQALDPVTLGDVPLPLADVYLLKSRTPHALGLARYLERRGAPVVILHHEIGSPELLPFYDDLATRFLVYRPTHPGYDG